MRNPIALRPLTLAEQPALAAGLGSTSSFTLRRCQLRLASQRGPRAGQLADQLGCGDHTVRNALHEFHRHGIAALQPRSTVAHQRPHAVFDAARRERLRDLLHQSPRTCGYQTSLWTLPWVAQMAYAQGLTPRPVSGEAIRQALQHMRVGWKRAQHGIIPFQIMFAGFRAPRMKS